MSLLKGWVPDTQTQSASMSTICSIVRSTTRSQSVVDIGIADWLTFVVLPPSSTIAVFTRMRPWIGMIRRMCG